MSRYRTLSLTGSLASVSFGILLFATLPTWLPYWTGFWQWALSLAFAELSS